ncbi:cellulose biosynthesis protein BcsS [Methylobacterium sp. 77]|uniref:cellulose biosynthesis protein BcsS n=1 Tax=Methylobacterium sp. 77 TaxID=1101192 RepID=UPI0003610482|nr:cellulose biosynthesis protein BcsS [Methylobacterium sp. 77]
MSALIFGSLDAGPSAFMSAGTKITFDGSDRDGFAILASGGGGARTERGPTIRGITTNLTRQTAIGAVLAGYQWFHDWGVVAAFAGPEGSIELERSVVGNVVQPFRYGIRLHGEVWARPTDATLLTVTAILGSTRQSAWGRLAWGHEIWGAYLGPEVALYVDGTGYSKFGIGVHATDFRIGDVRFRASLGYQTESSGDGGPYLTLGIWQPW